jgi:hypothetical protein
MRLSSALQTGFCGITILIGSLCLCARAQDAPAKDASASDLKGMPARVAPTEYQAQAKAGAVTVAADFLGHSVPTPEGIYGNEDYVVVEAALFGPPEARAKLSIGDFSLRVNGKKVALPSQPYQLAFKSLKDPEWEPPAKESKSKTSIGGNGGNQDGGPPAPVHMPMELRRAMEQRVHKVTMLEGDRALPQAGLLFFEYRGKTQGIRSLELIYTGSAGTATLALQP